MTPTETQAYLMVESLLCLDLFPESGATQYERTFSPREGMRTVFTGVFSNVHSVKVNGKAVTNYTPAFFNKTYGTFFNSIVFDCPPNCEVVVDADWGFDTIPADLQRLIDNAEAVASKTYQVKGVKRKEIEDFKVEYTDLSNDEEFMRQNAVTIRKYSMCHIPYILHGGC